MNKQELKAYINSHPEGCCVAVKDEDEVDIMYFEGDATNGIPSMYTARTSNFEEEHSTLDSLVNWILTLQ